MAAKFTRLVELCTPFASVTKRTLLMTTIHRPILAVIIGPPGSGKGTISSRIVRDYELGHLSSGDLLRKHIREKTSFGKEISRLVASGSLVDTSTLAPLMEHELESVQKVEPFYGWLLDGYPRTIEQAERLHKSNPPNIVIYLNVPFETIIERVKARWVHVPSGRVYNTEFNPPKKPFIDDITGDELTQREDDKPDSVMARLVQYKTSTDPVVNYYRGHGIVHEFAGTESNVIYPKVQAFLDDFRMKNNL